MNARAVSGSARERRNHDDSIVPRSNRHSHAVVFAALVFAQQRVGFGVEKVGMRIQHVQHAGNGAVVDSFVRIHRLGIILLDNVIDPAELLQALADIGVAVVSGSGILLGEEHSHETASCQK